MPEGHIFGVPSKHETGSVSSLLKGDYSPEQLQDDADLGKSVKEACRNLGPAGRVTHFFNLLMFSSCGAEQFALPRNCAQDCIANFVLGAWEHDVLFALRLSCAPIWIP